MFYADPWDEGPRLERLLDDSLLGDRDETVAVGYPRPVPLPVAHHPLAPAGPRDVVILRPRPSRLNDTH